jgi:hypothetical protein
VIVVVVVVVIVELVIWDHLLNKKVKGERLKSCWFFALKGQLISAQGSALRLRPLMPIRPERAA